MTIEFGAEIEVNGVRPKWLRGQDRTPLRYLTINGISFTQEIEYWRWQNWDAGQWRYVRHIRLPADHFAYKAIAAGFEPWGGGDSAPDDWDGGEVLWRSRETSNSDNDFSWGDEQGIHDSSSRRPWDIIGYRKKAAAQPVADATPLWNAIDTAKQVLDALQCAVADHVTQQPTDKALTIRITGPQGSGKTRWAEMLRELIPAMSKVAGLPVPVVVDAGEEVVL